MHTDTSGCGLIITTFSSHIARLKTIVECGRKLGRKVVFLGRSLSKYTSAAQEVGIVDFSDVEIIRYSRQVKKKIKQIMREGKEKYLVVCTGHQGEPKAILSRLARGELPWEWDADDCVIFSSQVIPSEINKEQSKVLEGHLHKHRARIFRDVHASGHGSREDLKQMIELLRPEHVIPSHGIKMMTDAMEELCELLGIPEDHIHSIKTGESLILEP